MSAVMGVADWRDYDQAALDAQYDNHAASGEAMAARIGSRARLLQIAGANHFSQTEALLDARTPLSRRMHDLLTQETTP